MVSACHWRKHPTLLPQPIGIGVCLGPLVVEHIVPHRSCSFAVRSCGCPPRALRFVDVSIAWMAASRNLSSVTKARSSGYARSSAASFASSPALSVSSIQKSFFTISTRGENAAGDAEQPCVRPSLWGTRERARQDGVEGCCEVWRQVVDV